MDACYLTSVRLWLNLACIVCIDVNFDEGLLTATGGHGRCSRVWDQLELGRLGTAKNVAKSEFRKIER